MSTARQKALENFVNDKVETTPNKTLFIWRGRVYQVLPYKQIRSFGSREDHFIKWTFKQYVYGIREYNPKLPIDKPTDDLL